MNGTGERRLAAVLQFNDFFFKKKKRKRGSSSSAWVSKDRAD
jgi:hypothetical protein